MPLILRIIGCSSEVLPWTYKPCPPAPPCCLLILSHQPLRGDQTLEKDMFKSSWATLASF